ncbi:radical SAM protein [Ostreiculturibacter nitratireducens]|uniref:radical SAM protein n=1 Tax=Ostreiculturibacter nitratireducens TaxID=3075226 RepID=UPI0031B5BC63
MDQTVNRANRGKFEDRKVTAKGELRASVRLSAPQTLWFNTGTLCNITCAHCYIESSPTNDRLEYITGAEVAAFLDELEERKWGVTEIGFTGGEPFMNPEMIDMARDALGRGYNVLILTNAMQPMQRPSVKSGLLALKEDFGDRLVLRVSLDHPDRELHEEERGSGSYKRTLQGMDWLARNGIRMTVAGRSLWHDEEADLRAAFARLFAARGYPIDAADPSQCVIFPEMDENVEVPEITTACWGILGKSPESVMCASSRMVVKRKGAPRASVVACTLLPYAPEFDLGETLAEAESEVYLNHPHCAKFCVLGGASCSA